MTHPAQRTQTAPPGCDPAGGLGDTEDPAEAFPAGEARYRLTRNLRTRLQGCRRDGAYLEVGGQAGEVRVLTGAEATALNRDSPGSVEFAGHGPTPTPEDPALGPLPGDSLPERARWRFLLPMHEGHPLGERYGPLRRWEAGDVAELSREEVRALLKACSGCLEPAYDETR